VASSAPKSDPRRRTWQLTRSGQELVDRLRPEWRRREAIIQACLSEVERGVLLDLLERLFVASEVLRTEEGVALHVQQKNATRPAAPKGRAHHAAAK